MSTIKTVTLAGASGALGTPLLQALLDAGFTVTALTRESSTQSFPSSVKVAKVDYNDVDGLTVALKGQDALISALGTTSIDSQYHLIDAAVAAGVKRIIPSEFGCDIDHPKAAVMPVYQPKIQIRKHIEEKIKGTSTTYTYVINNMFLDWTMDHGWGVEPKNRRMEMFDGGETPYTATPIPFVAKGTAAVLQHPEETQNRSVKLHGTGLTQKQLLEISKRALGGDIDVTHSSTGEGEKEAFEILAKDPGNVMGWVMPMLKRCAFGEGYGGDFSGDNDNKLLGLVDLSDEEVEDIVRSKA